MGSLYGALLRLRRLTLRHQGFWEAFAPSFFASLAALRRLWRLYAVLFACYWRVFRVFLQALLM